MKTCYLDANVLLYFKGELSPFHAEAVRLLTMLTQEGMGFAISPLVLDEVFHAVRREMQKNSRATYPVLKRFLASILELPHLRIVPVPAEPPEQAKVLRFMEQLSLRPRDAYHLMTMKYHAVEYFATFDTDFTEVFAAGGIGNAREFVR